MSDLVNKDSTEESETSSTLSSNEVSQSVPQSSQVLMKYKQYLQSCYNARVLAPADKYLPTLDSPYINLAMITVGRYNPEQRDEFTRRTLHGGVDQILEKKKPIKIEDLLTPEDRDETHHMGISSNWEYREFPIITRFHPVSSTTESSKKPVRFILVEGPPGIGKSTFAWEVCRRWNDIESIKDYHTVVLLKLRERWVLNATSLSDLFRYPSRPDFSNSIAEEILESQGKGLFFVLDGFDEVSHSFHENSVIRSILCRQLLPECTIILTTRPVASCKLISICQPQVDKHIEIVGFTEEERVRYITEVFSKEPELQVNFLKYMFLVPHIKSMMYIPLNCAIIAQVYYESQSSHHLAIPRTRTQLYKALTHSLLVRHMKMTKGNDYECASVLPEGLDQRSMQIFKMLAKFAFENYHECSDDNERKVTFFKQDIPEGLVHFGFMNESTEMYASKGVERTFSFLHLSLQEYLAAWHLANGCSIGFQVAYHRLAVDPPAMEEVFLPEHLSMISPDHSSMFLPEKYYNGIIQEEKVLISSIGQQGITLKEPALFLAGITGFRCQSEDNSNLWENYLLDTAIVRYPHVLLQSLYEAQNPTIIPHYFAAESVPVSRVVFSIGYTVYLSESEYNIPIFDPYDCYALSYCLAYSQHQLTLYLVIGGGDHKYISLMEALVTGLNDHCQSTTPKLKLLSVIIQDDSSEVVKKSLLWLMKAKFLTEPETMNFQLETLNENGVIFLKSLVNIRAFLISVRSLTSWEWLPILKSLTSLNRLNIASRGECSSPPPTDVLCWLIEHRLTEIALDITLPSNTNYDLVVNPVIRSVLNSNQNITAMLLPNISHVTMAGIREILLHCSSLVTLQLKKTRLCYNGILYVCSSLRNNTTLRHLMIQDDPRLPPSSDSAVEQASMPGKITCKQFLLELSDILKDNTTLEQVMIQSLFFLPVYADGDMKCYQWTKPGPLQQFNELADTALANFQAPSHSIPVIIYYERFMSQEQSFSSGILVSSKPSLLNFNLTKAVLDIEFPPTALAMPDISNSIAVSVDLVLKFIVNYSTFTKVVLDNISRETMAGVCSIILHCSSLTTLELKRTTLGYNGILYICSALRQNTMLTRLVIYDDLQLPLSRTRRLLKVDNKIISFSSMERFPMPDKTTCTDFLLKLNNILKSNGTLKEIKIKSGLFLPLSEGEGGQYCQWTGLGPLQQFNLGAVASGISPILRRSFSSSDVTHHQTTLFWNRQFFTSMKPHNVFFKEFFSKRMLKRKLFPLFSFTAPDTDILQSFSSLDPRLKECLEIADLHQYVKRLRETYWGMLFGVGSVLQQQRTFN